MPTWAIVLKSLVSAFAATVLLAGCAGKIDSLSPIPSTGDSATLLDTGDTILLTVEDLEGVDGEYTVNGAGAISLPYVYEIEVRGLTVSEAQRRVAETFRDAGLLNNPAVKLQAPSLRPYYVLGEVNGAGEFPYREGMTVEAAIAAAGGFTYRAMTDKVQITRNIGGQEVVGSANPQTRVLPGDRILVLEKWF
jgi:polysaccharide export outer membrane protein